jgi:hypothetical protein
MKPNFHDIAGLWERDGSLRDIYVQDTETVHRYRFDRLLNQYECKYSFDGVALPFPGSRSVVGNRDGSHVLSILLDGPAVVCCHFFIPESWQSYFDAMDFNGSPTAYVFRCLHCGKLGGYSDCD